MKNTTPNLWSIGVLIMVNNHLLIIVVEAREAVLTSGTDDLVVYVMVDRFVVLVFVLVVVLSLAL
jgi:hypothetical protein